MERSTVWIDTVKRGPMVRDVQGIGTLVPEDVDWIQAEFDSQVFEEIKVLGQNLADKVKSLIHEGDVRRIIIKDEAGHTFVEIPVTVAAVGAVLAPVVAAVGALAAMAAKFTIVVEKAAPPDKPAAP